MRNTARISEFRRVVARHTRRLWKSATPGLVGCAGLLVACAGEDPGNESTETVAQASGYIPTLHVGGTDPVGRMWPRTNNRYTINVCFMSGRQVDNPNPRAAADYQLDKAMAMQALWDSWGTVAPIDFIDQGDCKDHLPVDDAWLPIQLVYWKDEAHGFLSWAAGPGMGVHVACGHNSSHPNYCPDCTIDCQIRINYDTRTSFRGIIVHETGHVLGLIDEHTRVDFPNPLFCAGAQMNSVPIPGQILMTTAPDLNSIMSHWPCQDNRWPRQPNAGNQWDNIAPSLRDELGITMLYPWSFSRTAGSISSTHGMNTENGVVIRADGAATTDVYAKGAHVDAFTNPKWWRRIGRRRSAYRYGVEMSAAYLADGLNDVYYQYTDYFNRVHDGRAPVIKDSALHTAITASATAAALL